jgi:hypothetical protein
LKISLPKKRTTGRRLSATMVLRSATLSFKG